MAEISLRPWQGEALKKAIDWLVADGRDRHFLINAAPGAGKTICASVIAKKLIDLGLIQRVVVIAPRVEVVRQWADEFKFVTGRHMSKVAGSDVSISGYGVDLCATWSAVQSLQEGFHAVCRSADTLVICDEHHHAAIKAAWGENADSAFAFAKYVIVLTGTPIRSDGMETVWLAYDDRGKIDHPDAGTYTLSYGDAVELKYCRPITFHRHEGRFTVDLEDGSEVPVSGLNPAEIGGSLKRVRGLQQALDFYRLACTPKFLDDGETPDTSSYQASMLEYGISKLNDVRNLIPNAGGLVIAPSIDIANYMADLLEALEGERPAVVHTQTPNVENRIAAFKNTNQRWIVSVAMISEGVDIKRLRVLVYLPTAKTELAFRQAMGRVVRTMGDTDYSRAYVIMPTLAIFEEYARRVEQEMRPQDRGDSQPKIKVCPICEFENSISAEMCVSCEYKFPARMQGFKACDKCEGLSHAGANECVHCGESFRMDFSITLNEALRVGAIVRGMDLNEEEVLQGEAFGDEIMARALAAGDDLIVGMLTKLPKESYGRLVSLLKQEGE